MSLYNRLCLINRLSTEAGRPYSDLKNRCVGRTTAAALYAISESIRHPGKEIFLIDHGGYKQTEYSRNEFAKTVRRIIEKLDLKDMEMRHSFSWHPESESAGGRSYKWVLVNNFSVDL